MTLEELDLLVKAPVPAPASAPLLLDPAVPLPAAPSFDVNAMNAAVVPGVGPSFPTPQLKGI